MIAFAPDKLLYMFESDSLSFFVKTDAMILACSFRYVGVMSSGGLESCSSHASHLGELLVACSSHVRLSSVSDGALAVANATAECVPMHDVDSSELALNYASSTLCNDMARIINGAIAEFSGGLIDASIVCTPGGYVMTLTIHHSFQSC